MIEIIGTIAAALAIAGVVLNNRGRRACFAIWLISNTLLLGIHANVGIWSLAARDGVFIFLAIQGWHYWSKNGIGK